MKSYLKIPAIEQHVHLGCSAEERKFQHPVHFKVELFFSVSPEACTTDQMSATPCYAEISELLGKVATAKEYATIEHLTQKGLDSLMEYLQNFKTLSMTRVLIEVTKLHPPVPAIKSGAVFALCIEL
jgi:dihydroneopterin aldolase